VVGEAHAGDREAEILLRPNDSHYHRLRAR
jgi:hypothetical protein